MSNRIKQLAQNKSGRVVISEPKEIALYSIRPSQKAIDRIEKLERLTVEAEQRLGNFVVGTAER